MSCRLAGTWLIALLASGASGAQRAVPEHVWPIEVQVDFRLVDRQPEWPRRLLEKLALANADLQNVDHPLDVGCPVEIAVASVSVYRAYRDGLIEGGSLPLETRAAPMARRSVTTVERMPHDTLAQPSPRRFEPTRLYLSPGPGWAHAREPANVAYAWVGSWKPDSSNGRGGGTEGLIDPWGRPGAYVFVHELGHVAGLVHRVVTRPEQLLADVVRPGDVPAGLRGGALPHQRCALHRRPVRALGRQGARGIAHAAPAAHRRLPRRPNRRVRTSRRCGASPPASPRATTCPPCMGWQSKGRLPAVPDRRRERRPAGRRRGRGAGRAAR